MQALQLGDLGLEILEALGTFFVPPNLRFDVAHQLVQLAHLRRGAFHDVALLLERRDLLGDRVGERLERDELTLGLHRFGRRGGQILERLSDAGGAGLGLGDAALRTGLPLLERAQARGDRFAGAAQLFLARAHLVEPLRHLAHRTAETVGVHAQGLEAATELEEPGDVVFQGKRLLEHAAQLVDLATELLGVFGVVRELPLGAALRLGNVFGLRVERLQDRHEPLERLDARLQLRNHFLSLGERLHQLRQMLAGFTGIGGQAFERDALALHVGENRAQVGGQLLGRGVTAEDIPSHMGIPPLGGGLSTAGRGTG